MESLETKNNIYYLPYSFRRLFSIKVHVDVFAKLKQEIVGLLGTKQRL